MAIYDKYDLDEYLYNASRTDEEASQAYMNAFQKFMQAKSVGETNEDFRRAEKRIFKMDRYSSNEAVIETLNSYYYDLISKGLDPALLDELMQYIDSISRSEASSETKTDLIRYAVAEFGIKYDLDCYLFGANVRVFDDYYNRVALSNQRRKGL